ncbi:diguanylate cyclase [Thioclava pacifica]|uniref:diguanylate cyclase n=1 Tax=Thioclava pacifica DSM 10166 TaxID=1353537 RepID=A0A074JU33_9RHOB|nr:diguanylate cyclase [Thioclava pacifica]KEO52877.1 hypothetical protein TP2_08020 [Thioclava pacifica DSM 10166]
MAGSILIVDDVATNRIVLKAKLSGARYTTLQAADGRAALALAMTEKPGLILLDTNLPDMRGSEVIARLRAEPETRRIPVIAMTVHDDPALRIELLKAGANEILTKPFDELVLLARLRSLLRAHASADETALRALTCHELGFAESFHDFAPPARIALIAHRPERALHWKAALARCLPTERIQVLSGDMPLDDPRAGEVPDIFVIEADLARNGDGLRLMSELRSRAVTRDSVIAIATVRTARETQATALDLGADELLPCDLSGPAAQEAALRLRAQLGQKRLRDRLRVSVDEGLRLAMVDPLTGLYNRRYANAHLARMSQRARRTGRASVVMVLDLDRFKRVNDSYGHRAGDHVLTAFAKALRANLRGADLIARIGGEEFLVVLPDTTLDDGYRTAERLRRAIETQSIRLPSGENISITLSIGLALGGTRDTDPQHLVDEADAALLNAKATGRNQVAVAQTSNAA